MTALLALLLLAPPDEAPSVPPAPPARVKAAEIEWLKRPGADDVDRLFPPEARKRWLTGVTTTDCRFAPGGNLTDCRVTSEEPKGLGFGEAAQRLAAMFTGRPKPAAPDLEGRSYMVKVEWTLPPPPAMFHCPDKMPEGLRYYPERAQRFNIEGEAQLLCRVDDKGRFTDCGLLSEKPEGNQFGPHAMALGCLMKGPKDSPGLLQVPIRFKLPQTTLR